MNGEKEGVGYEKYLLNHDGAADGEGHLVFFDL